MTAPDRRLADARLRPNANAAGVVSRGLSALIDAAMVLVLMVTAYALYAATVFLLDPRGFVPPDTSLSWFVNACLLLAVGYLTVSWTVLGGTRGERVMGLRVETRDGTPPALLRGAIRAVLCVSFPLGLLWSAVDPRQRSVQDLLVRTRVVYDWRHPQRPRGVRQAAWPSEPRTPPR